MKKIKIMIIDDDKEFLSELKEMLINCNYNVITDFGETITQENITRICPDVILLDIKLNKTSGFKIYGELKKSSVNKNIPVILMTGVYTEKEQAFVIKTCTNNNYILKPFEPSDLVKKIELCSHLT
jgi:DNA-binding response OmpR family regulator